MLSRIQLYRALKILSSDIPKEVYERIPTLVIQSAFEVVAAIILTDVANENDESEIILSAAIERVDDSYQYQHKQFADLYGAVVHWKTFSTARYSISDLLYLTGLVYEDWFQEKRNDEHDEVKGWLKAKLAVENQNKNVKKPVGAVEKGSRKKKTKN